MASEFDFEDNPVELPYERKRLPYWGAELRWWEAMNLALLQPSLRSFEQIASDPTGSLLRACIWMAASAAVFAVVALGIMQAPLPVIMIGAVLAIIAIVLDTLVRVLVINFFAFGMDATSGSRREFAMCYAAITAPFLPLMLLGLIPCLGTIIVLVLAVYGIILYTNAARAVYTLQSWKAFLVGVLFPGMISASFAAIIWGIAMVIVIRASFP